MTNYEKHKDQIIDFLKYRIGFNEDTEEIVECVEFDCDRCAFFDPKKACCIRDAKWFNDEAKKFTYNEKMYARINEKINYYVRNKSGILYGCIIKPEKGVNDAWMISDIYCVRINDYTSLSFSTIKWEDDVPTSRDEIINS